MDTKDTKRIILDALNGKLRVFVDVCNCGGDRAILAGLLAEELDSHAEALVEQEQPKPCKPPPKQVQQLSLRGGAVDVGDVVDNVAWILRNFADARNSYPRLVARYWAEFDGLGDLLGEDLFSQFLTWITRATSSKTIRNRAGEIQNARPELEACPDVARWRLKQSRAGRVT